jgi:hypothetical protein
MKGYKVFNSDFTCRGFQFEEGKEYQQNSPPVICQSGFHFCLLAQHCFSYYGFDPNNIVCEVEALGETVTHGEDSKIATNHIRVIRRLSWDEVLQVANSGKDNTGHSNSGNRNSGNWNSGNRNSGNQNSGNWNSGDRNSGNWNSGYRNSGNWNSGNRNSGNQNSGNWNSGNRNSGNQNSGNWNSGDRNSGNWNSGYRNSGNWNSGNWNSGNRNSGNQNSGNWNSGNRNSGYQNSGYRNSGAFCLDNDPILYLFDKPSKLRVKEWENHRAVQLMYNLNPTIWVPVYVMSDEDKVQNPKYGTTDGYLKTITLKEAWADLWGNLSDEDKAVFTSLENFDADKFYHITGIRV